MVRYDARFCFLDLDENGLKDSELKILKRLRAIDSDDERQLIRRDGEWNSIRVQQYLHEKKRFLELLMLLFHLTGGQPGRSWKVGSIKFRNTQNAKRNFYVMNGKAFFYTEYHKARSTLYVSYHIVRYLSRRVRELVVLYLAYVCPFANLLYNQKLVKRNEFDGDYIFCFDETNDRA